MGYEHALDRAQRYIIHFKGFREPFEADAAVYKDTALFSADKCGIALAGTEKGIESCHWDSPFFLIIIMLISAKLIVES